LGLPEAFIISYLALQYFLPQMEVGCSASAPHSTVSVTRRGGQAGVVSRSRGLNSERARRGGCHKGKPFQKFTMSVNHLQRYDYCLI
jgi:hypothetical protein